MRTQTRRQPLTAISVILLRDVLPFLVALIPFALGFLVGCLVRLMLAVWFTLLWGVAAFKSGYEAGGGPR